ncbi:hypothetical protein SAMN05216327_1209 [Dyadobacter sp. SG02]|uniref:hypothetical protein n=1 Tax=Dyadobacter sp. SG02 TaxID=1855291 RepID=UPI0008D2B7BE|nr:hypothetical protein [Dyadobacter sp. SG02]SEJ78853.1 hypothetical protein SAMN05216327_1209 [Dyadobacter sp. SG02]
MSRLPEKYRSWAKNILHNLWALSGEDKYIIRDSAPAIQQRFTRISLVVVAIGIVCFTGSFTFFEYAFDLPALVELVLSLFVAVVIGNLYVLLLYTITPLIFDNKRSQSMDQQKYTLIGAFTIRIFFIILIATSIAQPLGVLCLSRFADASIENYKKKYLQEALTAATSAIAAGEDNVEERKSQVEAERLVVSSLLDSSNFFVQRIRVLADSNLAYWGLMIAIWALFFYPIYQKYDIRNQKRFYLQKKEVEDRIVTDAYVQFKLHYEGLMVDRLSTYNSLLKHALVPVIGSIDSVAPGHAVKMYDELFAETEPIPFEKFEAWQDPPFRTVKKKDDRPVQPESALLNLLYPTNDQPSKS